MDFAVVTRRVRRGGPKSAPTSDFGFNSHWSSGIVQWLAAILFFRFIAPAHGGEAFRVAPDGAIRGSLPALLSTLPALNPTQTVCFAFGLPPGRPQHRALEAERLPICQTAWESNGVRYAQTVFITSLNESADVTRTEPGTNAVLLVHIIGENTNGEYTDASAAFSLAVAGKTQPLELTNRLVYLRAGQKRFLVAAIDIPSEGIRQDCGPVLKFHGYMPPSLKGSMTVKIPLHSLPDEPAMERLLDLEYDREFRRVKKTWSDRLKTGALPLIPVALETDSDAH